MNRFLQNLFKMVTARLIITLLTSSTVVYLLRDKVLPIVIDNSFNTIVMAFLLFVLAVNSQIISNLKRLNNSHLSLQIDLLFEKNKNKKVITDTNTINKIVELEKQRKELWLNGANEERLKILMRKDKKL